MKIERREEGVTMIPDRRIDISNSSDLKEQFVMLMEEGYTDVTVDFTHVDGIDSSGLGKLLLFQKRLREKEGTLRITNITSDYIRRMFVMIQLHRVIDIEDEA